MRLEKFSFFHLLCIENWLQNWPHCSTSPKSKYDKFSSKSGESIGNIAFNFLTKLDYRVTANIGSSESSDLHFQKFSLAKF